MIIYPNLKLTEFSTFELFKLGNLSTNIYLLPLLIEGNSLLSSVFVKSMTSGSSILVSYFDTTTGNRSNERYLLAEHAIIDPSMLDPTYGITSRITVTRIHNKPFCEVIIIGGTIEFGIYGTVVSSFASDLDNALQYEGEAIDLSKDKGIPIAAYETTTDEWSFLRTLNGKLQVDVPGVLQTTQQLINNKLSGSSINLSKGSTNLVINYAVPALKNFFLLYGIGTSNSWTKFVIKINDVIWQMRYNSFDNPSVELFFAAPIKLLAGDTLKVEVTNVSPYNSSDIDVFIYGALEDI